MKWPIQLGKTEIREHIEMRVHREMIETILMCCDEIGFPQDLEKFIIKFFGIALKIIARLD